MVSPCTNRHCNGFTVHFRHSDVNLLYYQHIYHYPVLLDKQVLSFCITRHINVPPPPVLLDIVMKAPCITTHSSLITKYKNLLLILSL